MDAPIAKQKTKAEASLSKKDSKWLVYYIENADAIANVQLHNHCA